LLAASAFDGGIKAEEHDTAGDEHGSEEPEQESTGLQGRPDGAIPDAMRRLKMGRGAEAHDAEHGWHRPLPRRQDGAGQEDVHLLPHGARKDRGKDPHPTFRTESLISMHFHR
jgi:hypothetical protein